MPDWEDVLMLKVIEAGLPEPQREFRFHPKRMFRFDLAYPDIKVAVEVEGGSFSHPVKCHKCGSMVMMRTKSGKMVKVFAGGRHTRGAGYLRDIEKYNSAAILGWSVVRVTPDMVRKGVAVAVVRAILESKK